MIKSQGTRQQQLQFGSLQLSLVTLFTALSCFAAPLNAQSPEDEANGVLEEVVVTAMRRGEQLLLDVPLAVSAFGGDWMEDRGFNDIDDFIQLAPGVSNVSSFDGLNQIQMRGISSGVGENNVGYYLDEVPMAFINQNFLPDLRTFDLQRVEVLRGPQSTLYGAGALAGVVRAVTRDPDLGVFEVKGDGSVSSTSDGGTNVDGNLALNVPIASDRIALRAVYMQEEQDGWIDQTVLGKSDYNDTDIRNLRLKLLGKLTDNFTATVMYWGSRLDTLSVPLSFDDRTNNAAAETPSQLDYDIYNLTLNYSGQSFDAISSTSYTQWETAQRGDFLLGFTIDGLLNPETFTQEIRFYSKSDGPWQWSSGAYYRDSDQTQIQTSDLLPLLGIDPVIQFDKVKSWNVFAEVTRTFMDGKFDLTAGARYIDEERSSEQKVRPSEPFTNDFDEVVPRFAMAYRPQDNWLTYFNYSQGFRSGINQFAVSLETAALFGIILPSAAEPETAHSYEFGIKGEYLDGSLTVDAAAFLIDWQDLQTVVPVVAGVLFGVVNAAEAKSPGLELAVNWSPVKSMTIGIMGSWNDAQIETDVIVESIVLDPGTGAPAGTAPIVVLQEGDRLNDVPEWTLGATFDYTRQLSANSRLVANATAQYASERTIRSFGQFAAGDELLNVDFRIGVDWEHWGLHLFANNLFDEGGIISPSLQKIDFGTRYRPQTIGLNLKFRY